MGFLGEIIMNDPFFNWILGLTAAGLTSTAISISGYLPARENFNLGVLRLDYPAATRKVPLAVLGFGLCYSAWLKCQERREWKRQYAHWKIHQEKLQAQQMAIAGKRQEIQEMARLQAFGQLAQLKAAEEVYPEMEAYIQPIEAHLESQQQAQQPMEAQVGAVQPGAFASPASPDQTPPPAASGDFLQSFLEYPSLVFGGMGAGKSWTVRYIAYQKAKAGHQVFLLDPHAASHEWKGIEHIGGGMDYAAIGEFLKWYIAEIKRRYKEFNKSGLSEEDWQQSIREQGRIVSVLVEEMTNYSERLMPKELGGEFFKSAMSDSRKALMPPLFCAHDRTLSCLGDAKGLARTRDASLLELELIPMIHPTTKKPVSSGKGRLKLPGHRDWIDVEIPKVDRKITDFRDVSQPQTVYPSSQPGNQAIVTPPQVIQTPQTFNSPNRPLTERERLEFVLNNSPDFQTSNPANSSLSEGASLLFNYLSMRPHGMPTRAIKKNWGTNNKYSSVEVEQFLTELRDRGLVTFDPQQNLWKPKPGHGSA
jgi:hypothetical protein